jgi:hypothetical protein
MIKAGIDQDALITVFAEASAKQGDAVRKAVGEATLRALQGRELTLDNIRKVVKNVAEAASLGIARNQGPRVDVEGLIGKTLAGIDGALLQAVEANRKALERFVSGGVSLTEKPLKDALANVEKMEDVFFSAVAKASQSAGPLQGPWQDALEAFRSKGSATGSQAAQTVESLLGQAQTMLREGRASGMKAAQAMLDSYAALASGVLIGMSEGLRAGTAKSNAAGAAAPNGRGPAGSGDGASAGAEAASSGGAGERASASRSSAAAKRSAAAPAKRSTGAAGKRSAR